MQRFTIINVKSCFEAYENKSACQYYVLGLEIIILKYLCENVLT